MHWHMVQALCLPLTVPLLPFVAAWIAACMSSVWIASDSAILVCILYKGLLMSAYLKLSLLRPCSVLALYLITLM